MSSTASRETLRKLLLELGLKFPGLVFLDRNCIYKSQSATVHEVDRTPVLFDPDLGGGGEGPVRCFDNESLDLGGHAVTDSAGRLTWKLSNFVCQAEDISYSAPASFVTTAMSSSPIFLTTRTLSIGSDVVIDVFSWDTNGVPAPNVSFAWRCWVLKQSPVL